MYMLEQDLKYQILGSASIENHESEPVFLQFYGAQESIPPAFVAWRAGTATQFLLGSLPP